MIEVSGRCLVRHDDENVPIAVRRGRAPRAASEQPLSRGCQCETMRSINACEAREHGWFAVIFAGLAEHQNLARKLGLTPLVASSLTMPPLRR